MLHHVTCHVTTVSCASSLSKRKEKENKINIKSEKLDKRKEKLFMSKVFYNTLPSCTLLLPFLFIIISSSFLIFFNSSFFYTSLYCFLHSCYETLWTWTIFIFFFFYFFWLYRNFVFLFFSFRDNEEVRDIAVTWHVTWYDIISLEHSGKI